MTAIGTFGFNILRNVVAGYGISAWESQAYLHVGGGEDSSVSRAAATAGVFFQCLLTRAVLNKIPLIGESPLIQKCFNVIQTLPVFGFLIEEVATTILGFETPEARSTKQLFEDALIGLSFVAKTALVITSIVSIFFTKSMAPLFLLTPFIVDLMLEDHSLHADLHQFVSWIHSSLQKITWWNFANTPLNLWAAAIQTLDCLKDFIDNRMTPAPNYDGAERANNAEFPQDAGLQGSIANHLRACYLNGFTDLRETSRQIVILDPTKWDATKETLDNVSSSVDFATPGQFAVLKEIEYALQHGMNFHADMANSCPNRTNRLRRLATKIGNLTQPQLFTIKRSILLSEELADQNLRAIKFEIHALTFAYTGEPRDDLDNRGRYEPANPVINANLFNTLINPAHTPELANILPALETALEGLEPAGRAPPAEPEPIAFESLENHIKERLLEALGEFVALSQNYVRTEGDAVFFDLEEAVNDIGSGAHLERAAELAVLKEIEHAIANRDTLHPTIVASQPNRAREFSTLTAKIRALPAERLMIVKKGIVFGRDIPDDVQNRGELQTIKNELDRLTFPYLGALAPKLDDGIDTFAQTLMATPPVRTALAGLHTRFLSL